MSSSELTKILIVDDSDINRAIHRKHLEPLPGVEIVEAPNGETALALARQHEFALFLLDINMPGMDGFELASLLRSEPLVEETPIVFITADAPDEVRRLRGYRMGAVDFLFQAPVDPEVLVQKARVFLRLHHKRQELKQTLREAQQEVREAHTKLEEYAQQHDHLREQATHDTLTRLPNRALFLDRLDSAIARAQRSKQHFALAYIDLDDFKSVNDKYGHATGDMLIVATGARLKRAVRSVDTVARLGGDEFAVIIEALDTVDAAEYVVEQLYGAITGLFDAEIAGKAVTLTPGASIGVAVYPDHALTRPDLLHLADLTMYAVKRTGGGFRIYDKSLQERHSRAPLRLVRSLGGDADRTVPAKRRT